MILALLNISILIVILYMMYITFVITNKWHRNKKNDDDFNTSGSTHLIKKFDEPFRTIVVTIILTIEITAFVFFFNNLIN